MLYEEIRTKQNLSYISICSLSILYSKFILMATCLGTNAVVVTRVFCIFVSVMRVCFHVANLMSVTIAPMCASASPVLHCSHIPYTLRMLQRVPNQTEHTALSSQRLS